MRTLAELCDACLQSYDTRRPTSGSGREAGEEMRSSTRPAWLLLLHHDMLGWAAAAVGGARNRERRLVPRPRSSVSSIVCFLTALTWT
jgi:hypothetical protein